MKNSFIVHRILKQKSPLTIFTIGALVPILWGVEASAVTLRQGVTNNSNQTANDLRLCFNTSVSGVSAVIGGRTYNSAVATNTSCGSANSNFAIFAEDAINPWTVPNGGRILVDFSSVLSAARIVTQGSSWTSNGNLIPGGFSPDPNTQLVSTPETTSIPSLISLGFLGIGAVLKRRLKA
jgi:hypothetical protein